MHGTTRCSVSRMRSNLTTRYKRLRDVAHIQMVVEHMDERRLRQRQCRAGEDMHQHRAGKDGDDAQPYQERAVREALEELGRTQKGVQP